MHKTFRNLWLGLVAGILLGLALSAGASPACRPAVDAIMETRISMVGHQWILCQPEGFLWTDTGERCRDAHNYLLASSSPAHRCLARYFDQCIPRYWRATGRQEFSGADLLGLCGVGS